MHKLAVTALVLFVAGSAYAQMGSTSATTNMNTTTNPGVQSSTTGTTTGTGMDTTTNSTLNTAPGSMDAMGSTSTLGVPSNRAQFGSFVTQRWDTNNDGFISRAEWDFNSPTWFSTNRTRAGRFSGWDTNNNGMLESTELQNTLSSSNLFGLYDGNGDGIIDATEGARIPTR